MNASERTIRVLVAEDSAATREHLVALLGASPRFEVAAAVSDGVEALAQAERVRPDVILMDIHMPRMDGLEATRRIMSLAPTPIVLVSAGFSRDDARMSFDAIKAGALTVLGKPAGEGHPDHAHSVRELLDTLRLMSEVRVIRRFSRTERPAAVAVPHLSRRVRLVAIGASTGGPAALAEILADLARGLAAPLLVVQHIASGFAASLADWLAGQTPLSVKLARGGEAARPGTVYLAPDGQQMGVDADGRIHLRTDPRDDGFCPSASYLFDSVAASFGRAALGVLLTGMGRDGVLGLKRLREAGAVTIAQNEATSVIYGMPGEAVRAGAAEHVLSPREIARLIRALAGERS